MKNLPLVRFYLSFGALLLGMPLSYSATKNAPYEKLHYKAQYYEELNKRNLHHSCCLAQLIYPTAILSYAPEEERVKSPLLNKATTLSVQKDSLALLKEEMHMSPQVYLYITSGYLRENFETEEHNGFSSVLVSTISLFLQHEYYYKLVKQYVLTEAKKGKEWDFITEWLEGEYRFRHVYTEDEAFRIDIDRFKEYHLELYSRKNNFLKHELILWLTEAHDWPVPTNKQIKEGDMAISLWPRLTRKERQIIKYKMKVIQLREKKGFFVRLLCFHIVNAMCVGHEKPSTATITLRDSFFEGKPCQAEVLYLLSRLYWGCIDSPSVLYSTGNLSLDIFCAPILAIFTLRNFLIMIWSTNFLLLCYLFFRIITWKGGLLSMSIPQGISEVADKIKAMLYWRQKQPTVQ